ncbi:MULTISPECIES: DUF6985 domain-containing protein [Vibrio]|uniref:DUF6985 domain-containing protein n=1 Tax=Vibrio TaxID=662 RepID=UPI001CDD720F|nr:MULTISPECIES: hypothetical protein [Vibrio]EIK0773431.1 hypothetical protein [Vibrio alginolyticus]MCA2490027.1 hypothetical protein [Vibrio alginolyticus]MDW1577191.1 hypothetical protein [Vibrio sp. Vb2880]MDW1782952.1 hypothetical protein [Vibrio sp. Vb2134]MDW2087129.1 hypothetical protein [Vibrio sp. 2134-1]
MKLIKNVEISECEIEGEVYFRMFGQYIALSAETDDLHFAEMCANYLDGLQAEIVDELCRASISYCNSYLEAIGEPLKSFSSPHEVLKLIYPSVLLVPYSEVGEPVIHMELNCEWEPEHGMEWIIRNDKVLYVGAFNGEDPGSNFDVKAPWNYA